MIYISTYPWIIPSLDHIDSFGDSMPLIPLEQSYHESVSALGATS